MSESTVDCFLPEEALTLAIPGLHPLIAVLGGTLGTRLLTALGTTPGEPAEDASLDDLAIIDRELARLFAARELYLAWVEQVREQDRPGMSPAQFLRAWSESTGRVVQLLRARRDLGGGAGADALLEAVYQELERRLPESGGEPTAWAPRGEAGPITAAIKRDEEAV